MFNYSIKTLDKKVQSLHSEYTRVVEVSDFNDMKPENADPEVIQMLTTIQGLIEDLNNGIRAIDDRKQFYLGHQREM